MKLKLNLDSLKLNQENAEHFLVLALCSVLIGAGVEVGRQIACKGRQHLNNVTEYVGDKTTLFHNKLFHKNEAKVHEEPKALLSPNLSPGQ